MAGRMPVPDKRLRRQGIVHKYFPVRYMTPKQLLEEKAVVAKKRDTPFRTKKHRALITPSKTPKMAVVVVQAPVAPVAAPAHEPSARAKEFHEKSTAVANPNELKELESRMEEVIKRIEKEIASLQAESKDAHWALDQIRIKIVGGF